MYVAPNVRKLMEECDGRVGWPQEGRRTATVK
jgi:hypothetical protein